MTEVKVRNVRIAKESHKIAKFRALTLDKTLKKYIEKLILDDYIRAEENERNKKMAP